MQKIIKKAVSLALVIALVLSSITMVHAAPAEELPHDMLPMRMAFESAGATVSFSNANRTVTVNHNGDVFVFHVGSREATLNGEAFELYHPVIIHQSRARISYDDIAFLFEGDAAILPETKRNAVISAFVLAEMFGVSGLTMAIVHHETGYTWTQGIGWADTASNRYVDETTLFDIGSITKLFTAMAIMQLVEDGAIDLDEPVTTYLPEFSVLSHPVYGGDYRNITTRMLLSHVSGLPVDIFGGMGAWGTRYEGFMNNFLPKLANMHMDMEETHRMSYANNAYTLMSVMVATLAGHDNMVQGFASFLQENIFGPAGMTASTFDVTMDSNISHAYFMQGMPFPPYVLLVNPIGAGGLYTSAHDMARFMHMIFAGGSIDGNQVLAEETLQQMLTVQDFGFTQLPGMQFGLGFYRTTLPGGFESIGHNGGWGGFMSTMHLDLENGVGVFVSANSMTGMQAAEGIALEALMNAEYELTGRRHEVAPLPPGVEATLTREELEKFTGFYTTIGRVNIDDGSLGIEGQLYAADVPGIPFPLVFTPYTDGSFGTALGVRFWFEEIDGTMTIIQGAPGFGGHPFVAVGERIELWQADEDFERWVGTYQYVSALPDGYYDFYMFPSFTLGIDSYGYAFVLYDSMPELAALGGGMAPLPIIRIDEYTFFVSGTGRNMGTVIRLSDEDGVAWMDIVGVRAVRG